MGAVLVLAVAGAAQAAAKAANPSFDVTVASTYVRHHIAHIASKPQQNGCVFHIDSDATQQVTTKLQTPAVLTLRQLRHGVKPFALMVARETRSGNYSYGYQDGCPNLTTTPRLVSDTSGCGTRTFMVLSANVALGYIGGTNNFRFTSVYDGPDAFRGSCLHEVFATDDLGNAAAADIEVPPAIWLKTTPPTQWWTTLDPAKLTTGKKVVVKFAQSATIVNPDPTGSPAAYDQAVYSDAYTVSWTVTLTPVKH